MGDAAAAVKTAVAIAPAAVAAAEQALHPPDRAGPRHPPPPPFIGVAAAAAVADGVELAGAGAGTPGSIGVALLPGDDGIIEVHPAACHECDFAAEMEWLYNGEGEPPLGDWDGDGDNAILAGTDDWDEMSPLDRYPNETDLFDVAEQFEEKAAQSKRANRPKKNQGDRSGVARADVPRRGKNSRNGGRIKARDHDKVVARKEKFTRRRPQRGYWPDDGCIEFERRPAGDAVVRWRMDRAECRRHAAYRSANSVRIDGWQDPRAAAWQPAPARGVPVLSAEELGMDRDTWELLLQLQHREIDPNDYDVLLALDNTVEAKALEERKLRLFPTAVVVRCNASDVVVKDTVAKEHAVPYTICQVCQCEYEPDESVRKLPCGHMFHTECIDAWFTQGATCPADNREPDTPPGPPVGFAFVPLGGVPLDVTNASSPQIDDCDAGAAAPDLGDDIVPEQMGAPDGGGDDGAEAKGGKDDGARLSEDARARLYQRVDARCDCPGMVMQVLLESLPVPKVLELLEDDDVLDVKVALAVDAIAKREPPPALDQ
mmetsp:Transcript_26301/g.69113  ORF Transcript_26301/g.69113 Transcript_26301/m.69113 type:complete len:544 (+) Transcript_26301:85-1716(+)